MIYGCTPSVLDGSEYILDDMVEIPSTLKAPIQYSYDRYIQYVKDQGRQPTCVPTSISYLIELKNSFDNISYDMSIDYIYDIRADKNANGMSIKEALHHMKKVGYISNKDYKNNSLGSLKTIDYYVKLNSITYIKYSLLSNGPCIFALPVYDSGRNDFWNGNKFEGGHAICCIGYDENGFILKNTWGGAWGDFGNCYLPYSQVNDNLLEAWGLIL